MKWTTWLLQVCREEGDRERPVCQQTEVYVHACCFLLGLIVSFQLGRIIIDEEGFGTCEAQVVRSVSAWSAGQVHFTCGELCDCTGPKICLGRGEFLLQCVHGYDRQGGTLYLHTKSLFHIKHRRRSPQKQDCLCYFEEVLPTPLPPPPALLP